MPVQFQVNSYHTVKAKAFAIATPYPESYHTTIACKWQGAGRRRRRGGVRLRRAAVGAFTNGQKIDSTMHSRFFNKKNLGIWMESACRLRRHCASHAQGNVFWSGSWPEGIPVRQQLLLQQLRWSAHLIFGWKLNSTFCTPRRLEDIVAGCTMRYLSCDHCRR